MTEQKQVSTKRLQIITFAVLIFVCVAALSITCFVAPALQKAKIQKVEELWNAGDSKTACALLKEVKKTDISSIKQKFLQKAKVGDYVLFGAYEQDNDLDNGKEAIEWRVLDKKDDKILVISRYALDYMDFNEVSQDSFMWQDCATLAEQLKKHIDFAETLSWVVQWLSFLSGWERV